MHNENQNVNLKNIAWSRRNKRLEYSLQMINKFDVMHLQYTHTKYSDLIHPVRCQEREGWLIIIYMVKFLFCFRVSNFTLNSTMTLIKMHSLAACIAVSRNRKNKIEAMLSMAGKTKVKHTDFYFRLSNGLQRDSLWKPRLTTSLEPPKIHSFVSIAHRILHFQIISKRMVVFHSAAHVNIVCCWARRDVPTLPWCYSANNPIDATKLQWTWDKTQRSIEFEVWKSINTQMFRRYGVWIHFCGQTGQIDFHNNAFEQLQNNTKKMSLICWRAPKQAISRISFCTAKPPLYLPMHRLSCFSRFSYLTIHIYMIRALVCERIATSECVNG